MATSGYIQKDASFGYVRLSWSEASQSIANNTTTINYTLSIYRSSSISSTASKDYSIKINGITVASGTNTIGGSGTKTLKTGSTTISHNANGTKSFSYSFSQEIDITWSGSKIGTLTQSGTGTLDTIPRATTPTLSASSAELGKTITISTPRASSSFTHKLTYKIGSQTGTISSSVATSYTWTIPLSLANAIPSATSGTVTITCQTLNGSTAIGSKSISFKVTVPSSVVPSCSVAVSDSNTTYKTKFGAYIQNKSKAKVVVTASGAYSSTIKSYKTTINGVSYASASFTSNTLTKSGTIAITTVVTDSRGRTKSVTTNISVLAYEAPKITSFSCNRADSTGAYCDDCQYLNANINFTIASLSQKNDKTYTLQYKLKSSTTWENVATGSVYSFNSSILSSDAILDINSSYDVRLQVKDYFTTAYAYWDIGTAFTLMDFHSGGRGIAFGKVSEKSDGVEFGIKAYFQHGENPEGAIELPNGADLNDYLDVGFYVIGNTSISSTILNKPSLLAGDNGTGYLEVLKSGDGMQKIQRLAHCSKNNQFLFQRIYYTSEWGDWFVVGGGTEWRNLTITGTFEKYGTNTEPKYRVNGNLVTVTGTVKPTATITSNTTGVIFATGINALYRPKVSVQFVCQGSGINRWVLSVNTDGSIAVSRYGTNDYVDIPSGAWLTFCATYSI